MTLTNLDEEAIGLLLEEEEQSVGNDLFDDDTERVSVSEYEDACAAARVGRSSAGLGDACCRGGSACVGDVYVYMLFILFRN